MSAFIMAMVCTFLLYSIWKFRARPGDEDRDGPPLHGNTMLEIVWTVIPTRDRGRIRDRRRPRAGAKREDLPQRDGGQGARPAVRLDVHRTPNGVKSAVLVLEKHQPTQFDITSVEHDVIHSFYVPQFRVKSDAVPGLDHPHLRHAHPDRHLHADLHRAVRAGALADAGRGAGAVAGATSSRGSPTCRAGPADTGRSVDGRAHAAEIGHGGRTGR